MREDNDSGLKFSLRLSSELAEQVRALAKRQKSTPYRAVKQILADEVPASLAEAISPRQRFDELRADQVELKREVSKSITIAQSAVELQAEMSTLLRHISEELSGQRQPEKHEALWREVKAQIAAMKTGAAQPEGVK